MRSPSASDPLVLALPLAVLLVALSEVLRAPLAVLAADPAAAAGLLGHAVVGVVVDSVGTLLFAVLAITSRVMGVSRTRARILVALGGVAVTGSMILVVSTNPKLARLLPLHAVLVALGALAVASVELLFVPPEGASGRRRRALVGLAALALPGAAVLAWINPRVQEHFAAFHVALVPATVLLLLLGLGAVLTVRPARIARRLQLGAVTVLLLAGVVGSAAPWPRGRVLYLAYTMPGLLPRVLDPGRPVPTDDPDPDPAWTDPAGALARYATGSRLPPIPEDVDLSGMNVLLVSGEATRFDATSLADPDRDLTPALADLASDAQVFTRAYSPSSGTLHSMSAVHAMAVPSAVHLETWRRSWNGRLHDDEPRVAEAFRDARYATWWIGHNHKNAFDGVIGGFKNGFDHLDLVPSDTHAVDTDVAVADRAIAHLKQQGDARFFGWIFLVSPHSHYAEHYPDMPAASAHDKYLQEVRFMDEQLGRIVATLRETGLLERTIVVFIGDHGEEFGEHGGIYHKRTVYEESTHVPLVVRIPGMAAALHDGPTSTAYVFPWLMTRAGGALAAAAMPRIEGVLAPFLRATDDAVLIELVGHEMMSSALVWPHRKIIYDFYSGRAEAYDRDDDPGDLHDLAATDAGVRAEAEAALAPYRALRAQLARYQFRPQHDPRE